MKKDNRKHSSSKKHSFFSVILKLFATLFITSFLGFGVFLSLFATRITPPDIAYFAETAAHWAENFGAWKASKLEALKDWKETTFAKEEEPPTVTANSELAPGENQEKILASSTSRIPLFLQIDPRWNDKIYGGSDTIGIYGCGPTVVSMVVSALTEATVFPDEMATWAKNHGHFAPGDGSYHSIVPEGTVAHGLVCTSFFRPSKETLAKELSKGNLVVVLMNPGHFTSAGHFIILRGIDANGNLLIADPRSLENSTNSWDWNIIISEAKYGASNGGPFWSISKP